MATFSVIKLLKKLESYFSKKEFCRKGDGKFYEDGMPSRKDFVSISKMCINQRDCYW